MDEDIIQKLWENAGHGTRREDIEAAYKAGAEWMRGRAAKYFEELPDIALYGDDAAEIVRRLPVEPKT